MGASKDDYQSAQKALTERRGIKLSAAHVAFTACCCAFASQCAKKPMLAYTAAGIGCGLMVLGRCVPLGLVLHYSLASYCSLLTTYCQVRAARASQVPTQGVFSGRDPGAARDQVIRGHQG